MRAYFGNLAKASIATATLVLAIPGPTAAQAVRESCGPKPPMMRAISDDILDNCKIGALNDLIAEYEQNVAYHWCQWAHARRAKDEKFDEVTYELVQAQIDAGLALTKAAKGASKGPKGAKDSKAALKDMKKSLEHIKDAGQQAHSGFPDSVRQDEEFRRYANAEHQIGLAEKIRGQLEEKAANDPDCPPDEDEEERQGGGSYSGFGMTVYVLDATSIRIVSDCNDPDHRIQVKGETGTWATKGVGLSEVIVTDLDPDGTYSVRRRCDHKYSEALTFPLSALKGK